MNAQSYSQYKSSTQQGMVLILVLLIVGVVAALSVSFSSDFQITIAKAEQRFSGAQANQYVRSAESFAQWVLAKDATDNKESDGVVFDHLGESWSTVKVAPAVDGGWLELTPIDAQSRFNLNQLAGKPKPYNPLGTFVQRFTPQQRRFTRLLQTNENIQLSPIEAQNITEAVIDWIDADDSPTGSGGAESDFYSGATPAYRPANQAFSDVTELRLIRDISPELYEYLKPLVVVLPDDNGFNVNTADIALMRTINGSTIEAPLTIEQAEELVANRPAQTPQSIDSLPADSSEGEGKFYKKIEEFLESDGVASVFDSEIAAELETDGLEIGSDYFLLNTETQLLKQYRARVSLLKREPKDDTFRVFVISRSQSEL